MQENKKKKKMCKGSADEMCAIEGVSVIHFWIRHFINGKWVGLAYKPRSGCPSVVDDNVLLECVN